MNKIIKRKCGAQKQGMIEVDYSIRVKDQNANQILNSWSLSAECDICKGLSIGYSKINQSCWACNKMYEMFFFSNSVSNDDVLNALM